MYIRQGCMVKLYAYKEEFLPQSLLASGIYRFILIRGQKQIRRANSELFEVIEAR